MTVWVQVWSKAGSVALVNHTQQGCNQVLENTCISQQQVEKLKHWTAPHTRVSGGFNLLLKVCVNAQALNYDHTLNAACVFLLSVGFPSSCRSSRVVKETEVVHPYLSCATCVPVTTHTHTHKCTTCTTIFIFLNGTQTSFRFYSTNSKHGTLYHVVFIQHYLMHQKF